MCTVDFSSLFAVFLLYDISIYFWRFKKKLFQHLFNGKSSEESLDMLAGSAYLCDVAPQGERTSWGLCELCICAVCSRGHTHAYKSGLSLCH